MFANILFFLATVMPSVSRRSQNCRCPRQKCIKNRPCHSCPAGGRRGDDPGGSPAMSSTITGNSLPRHFSSNSI